MSGTGDEVGNGPAPCRTTADYILYLLGKQGVEYIFLNPGTDTAPYQEGAAFLAEQGVPVPRLLPCPYESVALAAAEGYWRAARRPQAVMVHVDVGTQNLGGMVHDAQRGHAGVLIIAGKTPYVDGDVKPGGRDTPIHWYQDQTDQIGIVRSYTKWAQELSRPEVANQAVSRALQLAGSSPAGPTYLVAARDVLMEPAKPDPSGRDSGYAVPSPGAIDEGTLRVLVDALSSAEQPVVVTSHLGRNPAAAPTLTRLVELVGAQVVGRPEAINIGWSHPLCLKSEAEGNRALRDADLIAIVACDVPWIPMTTRPRQDAFVVQIDTDPLKAGMPLWCYPVDLSVAADPAVALSQVLSGLEDRARTAPDRRKAWERRRESLTAAAQNRSVSGRSRPSGLSDPPTPADLMEALNGVLSEEDIVMEEAVTNAGAVYANLSREQPGTYFASGGSGLGWGLGASVGAKLAMPDRNVVAVLGDGSFLFGVPTAALTLAAEANAPFMAVILDNGRYRASQRPVLNLFPEGTSARTGRVVGAHFTRPPDFAKLAEACHAHGERVTERGQLPEALARAHKALGDGRCAVVDVVLDSAGKVG